MSTKKSTKKTVKKTAKKPVKKTPQAPKLFGAKLKLTEPGLWEGTCGKATVTVAAEDGNAECTVNLEDADGNTVLYCENSDETAQKACNLCKDEVLKGYKALGSLVNS